MLRCNAPSSVGGNRCLLASKHKKETHRLDGSVDGLEDGEGPLMALHQPQADQRRLRAHTLTCQQTCMGRLQHAVCHIYCSNQACSGAGTSADILYTVLSCRPSPTQHSQEITWCKSSSHLKGVAIRVPDRGQGAAADVHGGVHSQIGILHRHRGHLHAHPASHQTSLTLSLPRLD